MASDLQRLAEGVRAVGDAAGPTRRELAEAARLARSLGQSVPRDGGQSGSAVVAALAEAERRCRAADEALARFDAKADAFAKRLAGDGSGLGGSFRTVVHGVKTVAVTGGFIVLATLSNAPLAGAVLTRMGADDATRTAGATVAHQMGEGLDHGRELRQKGDEISKEIREGGRRSPYSTSAPPDPGVPRPRLWKPKA